MKKLLIYMLFMLICVCTAVCFSACGDHSGSGTQTGSGGTEHIHTRSAWVKEQPATCSSTGTKGHYECTVCHKYLDENNVEIEDLTIEIDSTAHKWNDGVTTQEPTCTEQGTKLFTCVHNKNRTKTEAIDIDENAFRTTY